jgi:hypothetical protein
MERDLWLCGIRNKINFLHLYKERGTSIIYFIKTLWVKLLQMCVSVPLWLLLSIKSWMTISVLAAQFQRQPEQHCCDFKNIPLKSLNNTYWLLILVLAQYFRIFQRLLFWLQENSFEECEHMLPVHFSISRRISESKQYCSDIKKIPLKSLNNTCWLLISILAANFRIKTVLFWLQENSFGELENMKTVDTCTGFTKGQN